LVKEGKEMLDFELLSKVDQDDEGYFSWRGCEMEGCPSAGLGNTVYDCHAYRTLKESQEDREGNLYELAVCGACLYEHEYGERPE
jgi:hypothetical protein